MELINRLISNEGQSIGISYADVNLKKVENFRPEYSEIRRSAFDLRMKFGYKMLLSWVPSFDGTVDHSNYTADEIAV